MSTVPRVCYEIFVRSFCDSNGDGIGDLNGITSKLDYLHDLGIEALWLTPIQPSSSYHKYDVQDYCGIEPEYGTLDDYRRLLAEAHARGMKVYMDLVINHTSEEHPWFKQACLGEDNPYRDFYWWMTPERIEALGVEKREETADAHVIFPWHDVPGDREKYYAMFIKSMPDLNYESKRLREEVYKIVRYWLTDIGVDGFRLDAARHIYPPWQRKKNVAFWEEFGEVVRQAKPDGYTVGEVWANADEVAPYFKGLSANFHFDLSYAMQAIIQSGRDAGLVKNLLSDYKRFATANPDFIDATMLTNHDMNRLGSVAGGHPGKMKLAAAMLLTLPGQPYIYYGEELGMLGVKPDPHIREAFRWTERSDDPQLAQWSRTVYSTPDVVRSEATQAVDPGSLLNVYKKLIAVRKANPALGQVLRPNLSAAACADRKTLAFYRTHPTHPVLVIHNLTGRPNKITLGKKELSYDNVVFRSHPDIKPNLARLTLPAYGSIVLGR